MKKLGYIFISIFFAIGIATNTNFIPTMPWLLALAFVFFLVGMYLLMLRNNDSKSVGFPFYENPPSPPSKKCICNVIEKHSPGARCEAKHK